MFTKIREAQESEKGFTLVELLVVIIIIGILAAVAIPAFLNQRQRANDAAVKSDVKNIAAQIETALVQTPDAAFITTGGDAPGYETGGTAHIYVGNTDPGTGGVNSSNATVSVNLTKDVFIRVHGDNKGYAILGTHQNGKQYYRVDPNEGPVGVGLKYDSATGGFKSGVVNWEEGY